MRDVVVLLGVRHGVLRLKANNFIVTFTFTIYTCLLRTGVHFNSTFDVRYVEFCYVSRTGMSNSFYTVRAAK